MRSDGSTLRWSFGSEVDLVRVDCNRDTGECVNANREQYVSTEEGKSVPDRIVARLRQCFRPKPRALSKVALAKIVPRLGSADADAAWARDVDDRVSERPTFTLLHVAGHTTFEVQRDVRRPCRNGAPCAHAPPVTEAVRQTVEHVAWLNPAGQGGGARGRLFAKSPVAVDVLVPLPLTTTEWRTRLAPMLDATAMSVEMLDASLWTRKPPEDARARMLAATHDPLERLAIEIMVPVLLLDWSATAAPDTTSPPFTHEDLAARVADIRRAYELVKTQLNDAERASIERTMATLGALVAPEYSFGLDSPKSP